MQIERLRAQIKVAIRSNDMERAKFLIRIVVGLRICMGEITVKLQSADKAFPALKLAA